MFSYRYYDGHIDHVSLLLYYIKIIIIIGIEGKREVMYWRLTMYIIWDGQFSRFSPKALKSRKLKIKAMGDRQLPPSNYITEILREVQSLMAFWIFTACSMRTIEHPYNATMKFRIAS